MATLETLRRQIDVATGLYGVVHTMKVLAATSIRPFEDAVAALDGYRATVELGLQVALRSGGAAVVSGAGVAEPRRRPTGDRPAAIVFGSDHGMCGQFNEQVAALAAGRIARWPAAAPVLALGERLPPRLEAAGVAVTERAGMPAALDGIGPAVDHTLLVMDEWREGRAVDRVVLFGHRPGAGTLSVPVAERLFPLSASWLTELAARPWPTRALPTALAAPDALLQGLTRQLLLATLFRAFAESLAAEHGSRLQAMQSAERNIRKRIDELDVRYHRQRQEEITEQTLDVLAGFEALSGER